MRPDDGDAAYLLDMVQACRLVVDFTRGRTLAEYERNALLRSGVERQIEIVGEAARRISTGFQDLHPEVPWRSIIAQRHVLAHEYGEVEHELIWRVATIHVPTLLQIIEQIAPAPPPLSDPGA